MSISGNLSDIAVVDLLQFVQMSQRSGTLVIDSPHGKAHISFQRGRIASAWSPKSPSVVRHLIDRGVLTDQAVQQVEADRRTMTPLPSLGRALLEAGLITLPDLRTAVATKIEQTIFELIGWRSGIFELIADEIHVDDELTFAPGEVLPDLDIDTQGILLEAVRLFDERNRGLTSKCATSPETKLEVADNVVPDRASVPTKPTRLQLLTKDPALAKVLTEGLRGVVRVSQVELRDAGAPAPGEGLPVVVVDRRGEQASKGVLKRIKELHPHSLTIAVVDGPTEIVDAFNEGAVAVAEPSYVTACCANVLRSRISDAEGGGNINLSSGLGRLRRALNELRSGLLSATVSLNLMAIVADSVERAVLFILQRNALVALGAFGTTLDGRSLATLTRGIALQLAPDSATSKCLEQGRATSIEYDSEQLPAELKTYVDRPRSGQGVLFPVLGARRAIGVIYADNGRRACGIQDVELMEVATAQVGLAFENELLRRQLIRSGSGERPIAVPTKGTQANVQKDSARR
jgi:hypothetical protein